MDLIVLFHAKGFNPFNTESVCSLRNRSIFEKKSIDRQTRNNKKGTNAIRIESSHLPASNVFQIMFAHI